MLSGGLWMMHVTACFAILSLPWDGVIRFLIVLALAVNLGRTILLNRQYYYCGGITAIGTGEVLSVFDPGKGWISADIGNESTVTPWLTVLYLVLPDDRKCTLVLLPDNLSREHFRQLRVWLRWRITKAT